MSRANGRSTKYWFAASSEEFPPSQMLEQARAADEAGLDGLGASDHFAPWFPEGQAAQAIILQTGIAWHADDRAALEGARKWKPTQMSEVYLEDIHDPAKMQRMAEGKVSDEQFARDGFIVGSDVDRHVESIRELAAAGATVVCLQLIGDADPLGTIRTYGEKVLPALRGAPVS